MPAVIQISAPKNRIYIGLEGYFQEDDAQRAGDEAIAGLKRMRPGFDVVSDVSQFKPASPQAAEHIVRVQRTMKELGMRRLVRVIGGNALAKMQMQRTGNQAGGMDADYVATREDADRLLDQPR